nr:MAG TPA: hypothetical protein [Caudoviricetes sp.]
MIRALFISLRFVGNFPQVFHHLGDLITSP